jgi:hypothetical protein
MTKLFIFGKFSVNFFFFFFFGYHGFTSNLEHACENLGGLGPLVWEEIENEQTGHKTNYYIDTWPCLIQGLRIT